jgi:rifampicin phosphotransferase
MTPAAASRPVVRLGDDAATDPRVAGRKAATLARLRSAGFPVPDGFVLTVDAVSRIPPRGTPLPAEVRAALASALDAHGDGELAVRSSGVAEDLPGASFAGQYESALGVRGLDALVDAVSRCRASGSSQRVTAYRTEAGAGDAGMAILVQDFVAADAAGVAFTANPLTGDAETLVSAVRGVGERLVSGEATPDEWIVRDAEAVSGAATEGAIDANQARRVATLAQRVEEALDRPQDIEWALADGSLFLLQARPITALPRPPRLEPLPEGFWQKDEMHYPLPLTPFGASVYLPALAQGFGPLIERFGLLVEGADLRSRGGEVYMRMLPIGGKEREAPPRWVLWLASRLVPAIRRRARAAERALRTDAAGRLVEQWNDRWRDEFRVESVRHGSRDLASLENDELVVHLDAIEDFLHRGQRVHFLLFGAYVLALYELVETCRDLFGWGPAEALGLVSGTSGASSEPGRALDELSAAIAASPGARDVVSSGGPDVLERLREAAPAAASAFDSYLDEHGRRTLSYDPGDATLAERPELLAGLVRERLSGGPGVGDVGAAREEAVARARDALAASSEEDPARFERVLSAAERAYPSREENVIWTDNVPCGLLRRVAIEIGRRLAERGGIAHAEDAVFLEANELKAALGRGSQALRDLVARRRAERAWVIAHPGPPSYGKAPATPDLSGLPSALRHITGALLSFQELSQPVPEPQEGVIAGVPGSPGVHTGPIRVIRGESEFPLLRRGDVLVCPITSPAWSPLFAQAGAVVTDGGGVLAHAAVIAREYAIPAVLATGDATRRLRDGEIVTVDGTSGLVRADGAARGQAARPRDEAESVR